MWGLWARRRSLSCFVASSTEYRRFCFGISGFTGRVIDQRWWPACRELRIGSELWDAGASATHRAASLWLHHQARCRAIWFANFCPSLRRPWKTRCVSCRIVSSSPLRCPIFHSAPGKRSSFVTSLCPTSTRNGKVCRSSCLTLP